MSLTIAIAGAGPVALGTAALAVSRGHAARVWSPSGRADVLEGDGTLRASGAIEGVFAVRAADAPAALADGADLVVLALPANGHLSVMERLAPHLAGGQTVAVSSHASLGALYLGDLLHRRGLELPVVAWGTTAVTGRLAPEGGVRVNTVRARVDACVVPEAHSDTALATCREAFGERFAVRDGLLAITLSNLNPQNHLGIALGNMTRMERGETWGQGENVTPNVGRLLEALDEERLGVARALGLEVKTIFEHFHQSFHVPIASIHEMNQAMHAKGTGGTGPSSAESRYVLEDVPFGLAPIARLARLVGAPARLHEAGIAILSAMYGRDLAAENDLLPAIGFDRLSLADLQEGAKLGRVPERQAQRRPGRQNHKEPAAAEGPANTRRKSHD